MDYETRPRRIWEDFALAFLNLGYLPSLFIRESPFQGGAFQYEIINLRAVKRRTAHENLLLWTLCSSKDKLQQALEVLAGS
jgi:hypothetical protein